MGRYEKGIPVFLNGYRGICNKYKDKRTIMAG
jgi:hypothetical protein